MEEAMPKKDRSTDEDQIDEAASMEEAMPEPQAAKPSTDGLVEMQKDGVTQHVHPTAVKAHVSAGWKHS
jgi:hypothetical protein